MFTLSYFKVIVDVDMIGDEVSHKIVQQNCGESDEGNNKMMNTLCSKAIQGQLSLMKMKVMKGNCEK